MKINYVIATYAGKNGVDCRNILRDMDPIPEDYLKVHLEKLGEITHNLAQVTVMKADSRGTDSYTNYYNIDDEIIKKVGCPVVFHDVPNEGISYGQYVRAFNKYKNKFNYYIFVEDDYYPYISRFGNVLTEIYKQKFDNKIDENKGLLCAWASDNEKKVMHPAHALMIINTESMIKMINYNNYKVLQQLRECGKGYCQVLFGIFFTSAGIAIKDYSDLYYTPYFHGKAKNCIDCCATTPKNDAAIFAPIQMYKCKRSEFATLKKHKYL